MTYRMYMGDWLFLAAMVILVTLALLDTNEQDQLTLHVSVTTSTDNNSPYTIDANGNVFMPSSDCDYSMWGEVTGGEVCTNDNEWVAVCQ